MNYTNPFIVDSWEIQTYEATWVALQLGFLSILPVRRQLKRVWACQAQRDRLSTPLRRAQYLLELWVERGLLVAIWENVKRLLCLSWLFFLFAAQTKGYHFARAISQGKAGYVATGRGFTTDAGSVVSLYAAYSQVLRCHRKLGYLSTNTEVQDMMLATVEMVSIRVCPIPSYPC